MGARLSETELQKSLDFCVQLFNPTSPEQHEEVANNKNIGKELMDVNAPLMDPATLAFALKRRTDGKGEESKEQGVQPKGVSANLASANLVVNDDGSTQDDPVSSDSETEMVLNKVNARRVVQAEFAIHVVESEALDGYVARLERGHLGLVEGPTKTV